MVKNDNRHKGKTGIVVKIDDDVAVIFDDSTMCEFKVSVENLVLASKVEKQVITNSEFRLYDLVVITGISGNIVN